ncbi:MAG: hypothetical protein AB1609_23215, partial [Bacillota bacterium]
GDRLRSAVELSPDPLQAGARAGPAGGRRRTDSAGPGGQEGPVVPSPGAFVADWPTFRRMVQIERRRMQRWSVPVTLIVIQLGTSTIDPGQSWEEVEAFYQQHVEPNGTGAAAAWQMRAASHLRQGDVVCPVGDRWLLVLLPHADEAAARRVAERLACLAGNGYSAEGEINPAAFQFRLLPLKPAA